MTIGDIMGNGFLIACAIIILVNVIRYTSRGFGKGVVCLITTTIAAVSAYLISRLVMPLVLLSGIQGLEKLLISYLPEAEEILSNPMIAEIFSKLVQMILLPALFCLIYSLLTPLAALLYRLGCHMIPRPIDNEESKPKVHHFGGMLMGTCVAFLSLMIYIMPLYGYVDVAHTAIHTLETHAPENLDTSTFDEVNEKYLRPVLDTPFVTPLYEQFGAPVFSRLSSVSWSGENTNLRNEANAISAIAGDIMRLVETAPEHYTETEAVAIRDISSNIEVSPMLRTILSELLRGTAKAWRSSDDVLGLTRPDAGENGNPILDALLEVFSTSTADNIGGDLVTFANILSLAVEQDIMKMLTGAQGEEFANVIASGGFLQEVKATVNQNPRMAPITKAISDVGMRLLVSELGLPEDYKENYTQLMDEMSTTLQETAVNEDGTLNADDLAERLEGVMETHDVDVDEAAVTLIAHGIADHFTAEELQTMTTADIVDKLIERFGSVDMSQLPEVPVN